MDLETVPLLAVSETIDHSRKEDSIKREACLALNFCHQLGDNLTKETKNEGQSSRREPEES